MTDKIIPGDGRSEILLVEDSVSQAQQLKFILEENGYSVVTVQNGMHAVEYLKDSLPEIIISDVLMPEMDGYELCRYIKKNDKTKNTPVILLTALSNPEDVIKGLQAGADNFITKPYNEFFLTNRIKYILLNKELRTSADNGSSVEIVFEGNKYNIQAGKTQILDLLLSTYENAIQKNQELANVNKELTIIHRELEQKNRQLEKLNEEKNKFLGMAAHDLRNPLSVIQGFSNFIIEEASNNLSKTHLDFLNIINSSSESMLQLVNDLLDITLIESGKLELHKERVLLTAYLQDIIAINKVLAERKNINLVFYHDNSRPSVLCDPGKFEQVVNNLISNAVKYSQPGTSVEINLSSSDSFIVLSVKDQGPGIPAKDRDKLFQPFSRANVKSTAGEKSTGLGLVIARKIVEGHGGKIWFESSEGMGSVFYVSLPLENKK